MANLKQNQNTEVAELPHRETNKGKSRDIVAKKLKMKSGREVERVVRAIKKIDELQERGRIDLN